MKSWAAGLYAVLLAAWAGSLWTVAWVAPVLFGALDRVTAGNLAGHLFTLVAWIGMVCAALLLPIRAFLLPGGRDWAMWVIAAMLALTLAGHFGVGGILADLRAQAAPLPIAQSAVRAQFGLWHGISTLLYLIQAVMALVLVARRR
jgi:hypothetical protein